MRRAGGKSLEGEYERYRELVLGMLGKRFPRFDADERLAIYHDAWARILAKRERGEEVENLRAYLLATCAAEALHVVSRNRRPLPVDPAEPLLVDLPDEGPSVDEQVVRRDQARIARSLLDSLDERQRQVLKLRWDLQLNSSEIRAALGLSRRQYQRLAEEGAAAIAEKVEELESGTWSRRQRSLLTACLVDVGEGADRRMGIATARQREEAQRLLESDPHFAALYAEVRQALRRAAALLPLPILLQPEALAPAGRFLDAVASTRDHLAEIVEKAKQQATSIYVRIADPTLLSSPRPGTALATLAGCIAVGGGAFGAYDAVSKTPERAPTPRVLPPTPALSATAATVVTHLRRTVPKPPPKIDEPSPEPATTTASPPIPSQPVVPPAPAPPPSPAPPNPSEFSFEN